ncbi:MAG: N4-gp56 family major capsid protein [Salinibacterium sp.]|nr:MAG: N4-gp56 family major capsid protein [Salinibacterium sp.]
MADAPTNFAALSGDYISAYITRELLERADRQIVLSQASKKYTLPQRMSKTLRVVRYNRLNLPTSTLTEGTPPDAVALSVGTKEVTVEQWGIVVLLTDIAAITTSHPALAQAIEVTSLAMEEVLERERANMLMAGLTQVYYPSAVTARSGLAATDKMTSTVIGKALSALQQLGAKPFEDGLFYGFMTPQQQNDVILSDTMFQNASNFSRVRKLEYAEIGEWIGAKWFRSNYLPTYKGAAVPIVAGAVDATTFKGTITAVDGGGTIGSAANFKFGIVFKDKTTGIERWVSGPSANIASAATGDNESFTVTVSATNLTNYVYDVYMTASGGAGSLFLVKSNQTATTSTITAVPAGTEATMPVAPNPTGAVETFNAFLFGRNCWGEVELSGMSLQSYLTPDSASYSNPLAQGRKAGAKIAWKSFILDANFGCRIETGSTFSANLPA